MNNTSGEELASYQARQIQKEMELLRASLSVRSARLSSSTSEYFSWRSWWRRHPVAIASGLAATGFLLAPRRKHRRQSPAELASVSELKSTEPGFLYGIAQTIRPIATDILSRYIRSNMTSVLQAVSRAPGISRFERSEE